MAFVEMGPVSKGIMHLVSKGLKPRKQAPLYTRETPRYRADHAGITPEEQRAIETAPLNSSEAKERDQLRSLRDAIHPDRLS